MAFVAAWSGIFCVVTVLAAESLLAEPGRWVEQSVRDLLTARTVSEAQRSVRRSRRSRALEVLCANQLEGAQFPEACLKLVSLAGRTDVLTAAERNRIDRALESRCRKDNFSSVRITIDAETRLPKWCRDKIRSHNDDIDYTYSMHP